MGKASDIRELREALVRFAKAEDTHARLAGVQDPRLITNTSRDEVDWAHADLLRAWPVRRINAVLNAAEEALDPDVAADREQQRRQRMLAPKRKPKSASSLRARDGGEGL